MANIPLITPADLFRNAVLTRQQGSPTDPYGLARAIGSLGTGYGDMNSELTSGAHAVDAVSKSLAAEAAGVYPAQARQSVAANNLGTELSTGALRTRQTIEEAYQAAISRGLKPGTRAFNDYMVSHVNTYDAASRITPEVARGNLQAQTQEVQQAAMKKALDNEIRQTVINRYVKENKDAAIQAADINGIPRQVAVRQLAEYAARLGDAAVEKIGAKVFVDPDNGMIKALDAQSNPIPIPAVVQAAGYAMGGNSIPFGIFKQLTKDQQAAVRQAQLNANTAGLVDLHEAQAQKALNPPQVKPVKQELDPLLKEKLTDIRRIRDAYYKAVQKAAADGSEVPKALQDDYDAAMADWKLIHAPRAGTSGIITGTNPATGGNPAQDFGQSSLDTYGLPVKTAPIMANPALQPGMDYAAPPYVPPTAPAYRQAYTGTPLLPYVNNVLRDLYNSPDDLSGLTPEQRARFDAAQYGG